MSRINAVTAAFAAPAEQRVLGRLADLFQYLPAACAFVAVGQQRLDGDARHVGQGEGAGWTLAFDQLAARGDADLAEVEALERLEILGRGMDARRGLQAGADALLGALELERAGDDAAQRAHRLPLLAQRRIEPGGGDLGIDAQMHAVLAAVRHVLGPARARPPRR